MIEEFMWRQLKRETKTFDFVQKKSVENYNLVLAPIIKALELFKSKTDQSKAVEYVKDAYKIIGSNRQGHKHCKDGENKKGTTP